MTLTIDPPGSHTFLYLSTFRSSLLFAAAPSSLADLGKMFELHGWAICLSVCLSVCLVCLFVCLFAVRIEFYITEYNPIVSFVEF